MKRAMIADPTLDEMIEDVAGAPSGVQGNAPDAVLARSTTATAPAHDAASVPESAHATDVVTRPFDFVPHQFGYPNTDGPATLQPDELLLWRFRAEWKELSRDAGYTRLSKAELARVRTHPNRALGKRFAVGRAMLREILSSVTGIAASQLDIVDDLRGRPQLVRASDTEPVAVALVNAGVWILVGVAATSFGLDSVLMAQTEGRRVSAAGRVTTSRRKPAGALEQARRQVRQTCIEQASDTKLDDSDLSLLRDADSSAIVELPAAGVWQLVDLPMPDAICAAAAFSTRIARVHAYGWVGRDGRAIAGQASDLSI